jgi:hypothetical protein
MTYLDHDRAAVHHRHEATAHEVAADLATERDDTLGATRHREAHDFHLATAHHHETQSTLARLLVAEVPATVPAG